MKRIYIITWTGRDSDSGVWDTYPCWEHGFFTDITKAEYYANYLNNHEPQEFDDQADEPTGYWFIGVEKHKEQKK